MLSRKPTHLIHLPDEPAAVCNEDLSQTSLSISGSCRTSRQGARSRVQTHRAVTLVEVLLVLALLVVLAAVAWPSLEPSLASVELRKSADRIRMEWTRARVESLSTGSTILFRYEPQGNLYCLQRQPEPQFSPGAAESVSAQLVEDSQSREYFLPEKISFLESEISDGAVGSLETNLDSAAGEWSEPITFYPDGSASDARLVLGNERQQCIEISLRGLTGTVRVGDVYSNTEVVP